MNLKSDRDYRLVGLLLTLLGGVMSYWEILKPILEANAGKAAVEYSEQMGVVGPIALFLGLSYLTLGERVPSFLKRKPNKLTVLIIVFVVILYYFGYIIAMQIIFARLGYHPVPF